MNCRSHCVCRADGGLGFLPRNDGPLWTPHSSCVALPVIIKPIDVRRGGCLLTGTMYGCSLCLSCDSRVTLVVLACTFQFGGRLSPPTKHLSHLYILVLCASCTNSARLWECVLHWCLRKGLAPLSGDRHWQASKMRHHCSCLQQHSAKSQQAATGRGTWH